MHIKLARCLSLADYYVIYPVPASQQRDDDDDQERPTVNPVSQSIVLQAAHRRRRRRRRGWFNVEHCTVLTDTAMLLHISPIISIAARSSLYPMSLLYHETLSLIIIISCRWVVRCRSVCSLLHRCTLQLVVRPVQVLLIGGAIYNFTGGDK